MLVNTNQLIVTPFTLTLTPIYARPTLSFAVIVAMDRGRSPLQGMLL